MTSNVNIGHIHFIVAQILLQNWRERCTKRFYSKIYALSRTEISSNNLQNKLLYDSFLVTDTPESRKKVVCVSVQFAKGFYIQAPDITRKHMLTECIKACQLRLLILLCDIIRVYLSSCYFKVCKMTSHKHLDNQL